MGNTGNTRGYLKTTGPPHLIWRPRPVWFDWQSPDQHLGDPKKIVHFCPKIHINQPFTSHITQKHSRSKHKITTKHNSWNHGPCIASSFWSWCSSPRPCRILVEWVCWHQKSPQIIEQNILVIPIGSMYAIYGNIYNQYTPNVSIYTIHGSYGIYY